MKIKKFFFIFMLIAVIFASCTYYIVPNKKPVRAQKIILIEEEPNIVLVPGFNFVYYGKGYNGRLFFHKKHWYYFENGIWYKASSWKGPWIVVNRVPHKVIIARKKIVYKVKIIRKKHKKHKKF